MDGGAWWATGHRVTKSWTQLSDFTFTFIISYNPTKQIFLPSLVLRKYRLSVFPKATLGNMPDQSHT